ncbi:uncharacterized protein PgNI_00023 [Pyricularia grisea]|uniref:Uncharacterized protein n=1 Tax=Pyricularia grisea TaxID=148305 RepID=A0A6P8BL71_PYRGI|nr:uncharacterized protein PgNI_00023 [Pyricularia grisea]TLD17439.1 hypothetical protein PgNI_00023 [Pyricularia grisea]
MSTNVAREELALVCIIDTQLESDAWLFKLDRLIHLSETRKDILNKLGVEAMSNIDVLISRTLEAFSDNGLSLLNLLAGAHNDLAGGGVVTRNLQAPDGFDDFVYSFDISMHGKHLAFLFSPGTPEKVMAVSSPKLWPTTASTRRPASSQVLAQLYCTAKVADALISFFVVENLINDGRVAQVNAATAVESSHRDDDQDEWYAETGLQKQRPPAFSWASPALGKTPLHPKLWPYDAESVTLSLLAESPQQIVDVGLLEPNHLSQDATVGLKASLSCGRDDKGPMGDSGTLLLLLLVKQPPCTPRPGGRRLADYNTSVGPSCTV